MLSELTGVGVNTKTVMYHFLCCVELFGSELNVLLETPVADIASAYSPLLAEAVKRIREGKVIRKPGYDGVFGSVTPFKEGEIKQYEKEGEIIVCKKMR